MILKDFLTGLFSLFIAMVAVGCSRPCPGYPRDVEGIMPVGEQGRELVYVNGGKEVEMHCGIVDYTDKYGIRTNSKCACDVTASVAVEGNDAGDILYVNRFVMGPGEDLPASCEVTVCLSDFMGIDYQWSWLAFSNQDGLSVASWGEAGGRSCTLLGHWSAANGQDYEDVYRVEDAEAPCVLYVAVGKGILQMEFAAGNTWGLADSGAL